GIKEDMVEYQPDEKGKRRLELPRFGTEGLFLVDVRLDPVAVADVHGGLASEARRGGFQRGYAPGGDFVHVDVEGRLVELDHVGSRPLELARLLVEDRGEFARELLAAAVVVVVESIRHRHGTGERKLDRTLRLPS